MAGTALGAKSAGEQGAMVGAGIAAAQNVTFGLDVRNIKISQLQAIFLQQDR